MAAAGQAQQAGGPLQPPSTPTSSHPASTAPDSRKASSQDRHGLGSTSTSRTSTENGQGYPMPVGIHSHDYGDAVPMTSATGETVGQLSSTPLPDSWRSHLLRATQTEATAMAPISTASPHPSSSAADGQEGESRAHPHSGSLRVHHRSHTRSQRSSGNSFLLQDGLLDSVSARSEQLPHGRVRGKERHGASFGSGSSLRVPSTPENRMARGGTPDTTSASMSADDDYVDARLSQSPSPAGFSPGQSSGLPPGSGSPAVTTDTLDLDSAQIVSMALNLSESRRLAARRTVSGQQLPPRLTPLPDSAVGGSLRQQLQQQRRLSRNMSSRPERAGSRAVSAQSAHSLGGSPRVSNVDTPLQAAFEPQSADGGLSGSNGSTNAYRYNFSQSTLARAQKAKDYLELLAQQRRLLGLLPPLKPAASSSLPLSSSPTALHSRSASIVSPTLLSPNTEAARDAVVTAASDVHLGRPYNPLQYIRNRKVRARERKAMDGKAQGFGDVCRTTEWIDEVADWAAAGGPRGGTALPSFSSAEEVAAGLQGSPSGPSRSSGALASSVKPKRPRVDWVTDPADMIADLYWLEQDDNKKLVEDRHWRRVFPQDYGLYRPPSRWTDDNAMPASSGAAPSGGSGLVNAISSAGTAAATAAAGPLAVSRASNHVEIPSPQTPGSDNRELFFSTSGSGDLKQALVPSQSHRTHYGNDGTVHGGSTRERARQKLHDLKGFHHRHNSSLQGPDLMRLRHGSFSDSSDSESDRRRWGGSSSRPRTDTVGGVELLNHQMLEMIAQENREREAEAGSNLGGGLGNGSTSPLRPTPTRSHLSQVESTTSKISQPQAEAVNYVTPQSTAARSTNSAQRSARTSLEVPGTGGKWPSLDYDSSRPTSPELGATKHHESIGLVPALGGDLSSPPSRATSPAPRRRFKKVKNMFHDHSRERGTSSGADRGHDERDDTAAAAITTSAIATSAAGVALQEASIPQLHPVADDTLPVPTSATAMAGSRLEAGHEGKGSQSPVRKAASLENHGAFDSGHKSQGSITNLVGLGALASGSKRNHRGEDGKDGSGSGGVRGFFRGGPPRIDNAVRSGVSKMSDMLWRRDVDETAAVTMPQTATSSAAPSADAQLSSSSDDESETEGSSSMMRGRSRPSPLPSRSSSSHRATSQGDSQLLISTAKPGGAKHYLDVMPVFGKSDSRRSVYSSNTASNAISDTSSQQLAPPLAGMEPLSRPPSRRSTRFERLKPPRIDVRDVSPSSSSIAVDAGSKERIGAATAAAAAAATAAVGAELAPSVHRGQSRGSLDSDLSGAESRTRRSSRAGVDSSLANSTANGHVGGSSTMPTQAGTAADDGVVAGQPRRSVAQPSSIHSALSRRELARLRASLCSSAILAKELSRRAQESRDLDPAPKLITATTASVPAGSGKAEPNTLDDGYDDDDDDDDDDDEEYGKWTREDHKGTDEPGTRNAVDSAGGTRHRRRHRSPIIIKGSNGEVLRWSQLAAYMDTSSPILSTTVAPVELFPLAMQVLAGAIQRSGQAWQASAENFAGTTVPVLRQRIDAVRTRVAVDLSGLASQAADEADDVSRDLVAVQRLKVKRVEDRIDTMLRQRRRRFRWVRRAGWLTVEWVLVGCMWYVWFVVMLVRVVLGLFRGVFSCVRWLLWL